MGKKSKSIKQMEDLLQGLSVDDRLSRLLHAIVDSIKELDAKTKELREDFEDLDESFAETQDGIMGLLEAVCEDAEDDDEEWVDEETDDEEEDEDLNSKLVKFKPIDDDSGVPF